MKRFTTFAWICVVILLVFSGLIITDHIRLKERFQIAPSPVSAAIPSSENVVLSDSTGNLSSIAFPPGLIMIWRPTETYISSTGVITAPQGWALCDGTNGTPDLRGRFVLGANSETGQTLGSFGGSSSPSLSGTTGGRIPQWSIPIEGGLNLSMPTMPPYMALVYIIKL